MENVLCWAAGFMVAYLIVRAIRGMWTRVGLVLLCLGVVSQAATTTLDITIINYPGGNATVKQYIATVGGGCAGVFAQNLSGCAGAGTCHFTFGPYSYNTSYPYTFLMNTAQTASGTGVAIVASGTTYLTLNWTGGTCQSGAATDSVRCVSGWTNNLSCCVSLHIVATNAALHLGWQSGSTASLCPGDSMPAFCATNVLGLDGSGNGIAFTWDLVRSGCIEDDYIPKCIDCGGSSSNLPRPGGGGSSTTDPPTTDSNGNPPNTPGDTNRTSDQQLNDALANLTKLVAKEAKQDMQMKQQDEIADLLDYDLEAVMEAVNNTTNYMGWLYLLKEIKTNTFNTWGYTAASAVMATNISGQLTNIADQLTNTLGHFTNLSQMLTNGGAVSGTNLTAMGDSLSNLFGVSMAQFTNAFNASLGGELDSRLGGLSNQVGDGWAGGDSGPGGDDGPLTATFGKYNEWWICLNPLDSNFGAHFPGSGITGWLTKMLVGLAWVRSWFAAIIVFVLWWELYSLTMDYFARAQIPAGMVSAAPADWKTWFGKLTWGLIGQAILISLLLALPTTLMAWIDGALGTSAHLLPMVSGSGPTASIAGADSAGVALSWYGVMGLVIPWNTIWSGASTYFSFLLFGDKAINFLLGAIRAWKAAWGACFLLGWFSLMRLQAGEVAIDNLSGSVVVVSNDVERIELPAGHWSGNLVAGDWSVGSTGFVVQASEDWRNVVRIELGTNWDWGSSNWVVWNFTARTPVSSFKQGHIWGWIICGTVLGVSYVRLGLRAGAGRDSN